jgi:hypothetical protein
MLPFPKTSMGIFILLQVLKYDFLWLVFQAFLTALEIKISLIHV